MDAKQSRHILGMRVDATSYRDASSLIVQRAVAGQGGYVCAANVHMVMESFDSDVFRSVVNGALLVTPDGMPLVWGLRMLGVRSPRVCGPVLTLEVCAAAAENRIPVALYGGTEESLDAFAAFLNRRYPALRIACRISPPFRPLTADEDEDFTRELAVSGAKILFVGIGCPKQERWMAEHAARISAVMLGVGAAFDIHSGRVRQAPAILQSLGLEWLFRLTQEPRRLWKRYLKHNPRFVCRFMLQIISSKLKTLSSGRS